MFVGYRKGLKEKVIISDLECPSCHSVGGMTLYENSFRPTVMFVPVAKFNVKYYIFCQFCERGGEVDKEKARAIINS